MLIAFLDHFLVKWLKLYCFVCTSMNILERIRPQQVGVEQKPEDTKDVIKACKLFLLEYTLSENNRREQRRTSVTYV